MADNPVRSLAEALGVARTEESVEENVIGLEGGVGFEFAAPIAFVVLRGKEEFAGGTDGGGNTAEQAVDLAKTKLWCGIQVCVGGVGVCIHQFTAPLIYGSVNLR